jgi:membrane-associated phospholipid phosphatase
MQYRRLLIQSVCSVLACAGLVVICYYYIDRPVAEWVCNHSPFWPAPDWMRFSDFITAMMVAAPVLLVMAALRRLRGPWQRWEAQLAVIAASVFVMTLLKQLFKWTFGRPSSTLWIFSGGSAIPNNPDYAFHWFHGFFPYVAFPSGHLTVACTVGAIVWFIWPKWRWLALAVIAFVAVCLIITNYHYVGDIIAGAFLGWLGGLWTVQLMPAAWKPNPAPTPVASR